MLRKIFPLAVILFVAACGGAADSFDEGSDDVTSASLQLFTVQRDERKCAAPMCGGWWASAVQQDASPIYVTDLDLSRAQLDAQTEQSVRAAPAEELLLRARAGAADKRGFRQLVVKSVWRGMPGVVPAAKDAVWSMGQKTATDVKSGKSAAVSSVDVRDAARAFVDQDWLSSRVVSHGALAAAHVSSKVLDASQVWIHLPESIGPCAKPVEQACSGGQVQAYARTADRCLQPLGCVNRGICSMMMPSCADGYVAVTWTAANGCPATSCDPAWAH